MNQAIQVLDGCTYIGSKNALKVDIMASGQMLVCYIGGSDKESLIKLYNTKQFEIEEIIEKNLKQDKFNSDGELWLTAAAVYAY
ncbi:hypothetical protein [Paraglaciecola arctica]|uniref:Uncharacterized protein n=1 Tax=Paraglaciecola arctica BSs20135 TaxID=493475 RepID=K6YKG7_9ALTE|nr:hypothetical protein [Paraglaciecola arctica]GAC17113.1 hypothetical protein GARC_0131 [Paraglaciecola arctica BSs20135]